LTKLAEEYRVKENRVFEQRTTNKEADMNRLAGKVIIITGAGSGIGRVEAILFAKESAKIVVDDINMHAGEETVNMIKRVGGEAVFVHADVSKVKDVQRMVRVAIDTYGKLDVLLNNAGIALTESLEELTENNFDRTIAIDLKGSVLAMKYAIPEMLRLGGGSIINTTSVAADRGIPNFTSYTCAKGGLLALTRAAAVEYARRNIRINCISPGPVATAMVLEGRSKESQSIQLAAIPMGRWGEPEEVAQVALFLATDESSYITSQELIVDGGINADSHLRA
jgi:NAD(P)-dependent dehydrogenase (short-subunit alcohol dehydrogenase family)